MKKITIKLNSFNLEDAERAIITACIERNPNISINAISKLLDISERSVFRKINKYGLYKTNRFTLSEDSAIELLKGKGYKVEKETN